MKCNRSDLVLLLVILSDQNGHITFRLCLALRRHPGFLVFDEPGQHAMKPSSMKSLISASINTNKQVILAISKSVDKYSNAQAAIEVEGVKKLDNDYLITEAVRLGDVNIIDIDPKQYT